MALHGVGIPMLALGYAATVGLLVVDGRRFISVFAPVGRMALTNYLTVLGFGSGDEGRVQRFWPAVQPPPPSRVRPPE